jgi:DNA-binding winged helix-turn-helix (wHTH) protein
MDTKAFEFGDFRLDPSDCKLLSAGEPVALTPKAFDLLLLLIENRGRLIEKETLMKRLWPDAFVDEANLANNISLLRKALGDSANMIQTVPTAWYRFVGEVREQGAPPVVGVPARRLRRRPVAAASALAVLGQRVRSSWRALKRFMLRLTGRAGEILRSVHGGPGVGGMLNLVWLSGIAPYWLSSSTKLNE